MKLERWNLHQAGWTFIETEEAVKDLLASGYDDREALLKMLETGAKVSSKKFEYQKEDEGKDL